MLTNTTFYGTITPKKGGDVMNKLNLAGKKFGKLLVVKEIKDGTKMSKWLCHCDCGTKDFIARGTRLNQGITDNCGCDTINKVTKSQTKHGMRYTPFYHVWVSMKQRCNNPNTANSKYYNERGIVICDEWLIFQNFFDDMYESYKEGYFFDRINNDLGYYKENCRWVTTLESNRNKRSTLTKEKVLEIRNSNKTKTQLAKEYGVNYTTIVNVLTNRTWKDV